MFKNNHPAYFFTSDKTRIFYNTNFNPKDFDPQKALLVFNYGLVCSNFHWTYQIPFFDDKNFQMLTHDYRNHFTSSGEKNLNECNFYTITRDLFELIFSLNSKTLVKNAIMFGHSMGVNITLEFAKKYPDFIKGMILISGAPYSPKDVMFNTNLSHIAYSLLKSIKNKFPGILKISWEYNYMVPLMRKIIFDGGFNKKITSEYFIHTYMKKIGELSPDIFLHLLKEMHHHESISHFTNIKTPALIIGGDKDKLVPNYLQKIYKTYLKNSEFYLVKEGSHVPQVDFPKSINERSFNFIQKKCLTKPSR
jgi:pimeloyl-ACP methyl ester carboxylesterase